MHNPYYPPGADASQYEESIGERLPIYDGQRHDYRTPEEIHEDQEAYARSLKRIPTAANLAWQARLDATRKRYMAGGKI